MSADDESGAEDILEQGDDRLDSPGPGFAAPRWLGVLGPRSADGGGARPGSGWRPSRGAAVLAAVALLAGLAIGYAAGKGTSRAAPAPAPRAGSTTFSPRAVPRPANPPADAGPAVEEALQWCSEQTGKELQLGIAVTNQSGVTVSLTSVRPLFPETGAFREVSWAWAPCGAKTYGQSPSTIPLAPGASTWLSVTVKVLVSCPGPYPVQFSVGYVTGHLSAAVTLPGFSDLSQVNYSGCSPSGTSSSSSSTFSAIYLGPAGSPAIVHILKRRLRHPDPRRVLAGGPLVAIGIRLRGGLG